MAFVRRKGNKFYWCTTCAGARRFDRFISPASGNTRRSRSEWCANFQEAFIRGAELESSARAIEGQRVDLANMDSPAMQRLVRGLRELNLELGDMFPQILRISESSGVTNELLVQWLLESTLQVSRAQFDYKRELFVLLPFGGREEAATKDYILPLDPNLRSTGALEFENSLGSKIVGQDEGVQALVDCTRCSARD